MECTYYGGGNVNNKQDGLNGYREGEHGREGSWGEITKAEIKKEKYWKNYKI